MRWSRIILAAIDLGDCPADDRVLRYVIHLPLISDGRIALHELIANARWARVSCEMPEGQIEAGALVVQDKQCIFTWDERPVDTPPPIRLYAESVSLGATVALRPGFGPARLFEVVECTELPGTGQALPA